MLHPVGNRPPAVYWRRRLVLLASVAVLVVLSVLVLRSGDGSGTAAAASESTSAAQRSPAGSPSGASSAFPAASVASDGSASAVAGARTSPASAAATSKAASSASKAAAPPVACTAAQLSIAAVVGASSYAVGAEPQLMLQVENTGPKPCVQNLADSQVVLSVYNGESRVWGSHDCEVQPGTAERTLAVGAPVRVSITWSGLSSQPGCAGTRQRVGAGTYTLYAALSGHQGKAAQFSIG